MERMTERVNGEVVMDCGVCPLDAPETCNRLACRDRLKARLAAYEDTGLEPEEITVERPVCVFYCNRKCNIDGDWCAEGPGCQKEIGKETVMHLLELAKEE